MRWLVGAAVVLILGSAVSLALGWSKTNEPLIWGSISASGLAAAALIAAYVTGKKRTVGLPIRPRSVFLEPEAEARPEPAPPPLVPQTGEPSPGFSTSPGAARRLGPPAGRAGFRREASPGEVEVIAVPERKKYHRPECRYAKTKGTERITRSAARRRKYTACGICKP